jgi:anti-anti-sigma regulatory factor
LISGVAVTAAPAEIDVATAEQLQMALLEADRRGHATAATVRRNTALTIDVSALRFADSASVRALVLAARSSEEWGAGLILLAAATGGQVGYQRFGD